jgi:hypothetical protein
VDEIREQDRSPLYMMQVNRRPAATRAVAKPSNQGEGSAATFSRSEKKVGRNDPAPAAAARSIKIATAKTNDSTRRARPVFGE